MSDELPDITPDLPEVPDTPDVPDEENPEVPEESPYTLADYLRDISPLLTEGVLRVILARRRIPGDTPFDELEDRERDLAEAEVYYNLSNLPVGGATTKEVDGSWSHTDGGWTVSGANIAEWYRKYAALREKWGEEVLTKSRIRPINL